MEQEKKTSHDRFPKELKKTPTRLRLWEFLLEQKIPKDCTSIYEALKKDYESVSFSTVYRSLETLVELGYLEKVQLSHQETVSYQRIKNKDVHYAVCLSCHKLVEFAECPFEKRQAKLSEPNFYVVGHKVELQGYCETCRKALGNIR